MHMQGGGRDAGSCPGGKGARTGPVGSSTGGFRVLRKPSMLFTPNVLREQGTDQPG